MLHQRHALAGFVHVGKFADFARHTDNQLPDVTNS